MTAGPRLLVLGGGVAGLTAALAAARAGVRVTVVEERAEVGGTVAQAELSGVRLDVGAESIATRGGRAAALLDELGLAEQTCPPAAHGSWLRLSSGRAVPMPSGGVVGIPARPWAADTRAAIGWLGALRAARELLPASRAARVRLAEHSLGELVRERLGERVLTELVTPVTRGVYSADPADLDPELAAPGLLAAFAEHGSLIRAAASLRSAAPPGARVRGLRGGLGRVIEALEAAVIAAGGTVMTGVAAAALGQPGAGSPWAVTLSDGRVLLAEGVLLACAERSGRALLAPLIPAESAAPLALPAPVEVVTLLLDAPVLDAAPRGNGVLVAAPRAGAPRVSAKALTHSSAKWAWLAAELAGHPGRHAIRLSYGAQGAASPSAGLDDAALTALALADAGALLGVPLDAGQVRGMHRASWPGSQPVAQRGRAERGAALRRRIAGLGPAGTLDAAGAWLAGTGLAAVIPDAEAAAARLVDRLRPEPSPRPAEQNRATP